MAKIDVSQIEGYTNMTPEQKIAALEGYEVDYSGYVKKDVFDKTASELATAKKQLRDKMTDDEAARQKEQEEREKLQRDYEALLHKTTVSEHKAKFLAMGYEEKLAEETAEAMASGDTAKVFANQQKHLEAYGKKVRAEALKDTPKPTHDGGDKTMTLDKLRKLSPQERLEFYDKNKAEYKALYGGSE